MPLENLVYLVHSILMFMVFVYFFTNAFYFRPRKRFFHYVLSQISMVSSLSYYALFLEIGNITGHQGQIVRVPRHIDWLINTPLQLITLGTISHISIINIYALCFFDFLMIFSGLLGELTESWIRWSFFGIGSLCFLPLYIFLFEDFDFSIVLEFAGESVANNYYKIGRLLLSIWFFYPIIWILANSNHINSLTEGICYSILDLISKVCFPLWVLIMMQEKYLKDNDATGDTFESGSTTIITS